MAAPQFADWLRALMDAKKWSNADLSRASRVSASSITNYLMGTQPRMDSVVRIARAANIPEADALEAAGYESGEASREASAVMPEIAAILLGMTLDEQERWALPALRLAGEYKRLASPPVGS